MTQPVGFSCLFLERRRIFMTSNAAQVMVEVCCQISREVLRRHYTTLWVRIQVTRRQALSESVWRRAQSDTWSASQRVSSQLIRTMMLARIKGAPAHW
jgi:hypothetical protein